MLALIAGEGHLPAVLVASCPQRPLICSLEGFLPDDLTPDVMFRIETLGTLLAALTERGVTQVCFVGAIRRPSVDPARIDAATWPLVPVLQQAIVNSDDGALRAVIGIFEQAGLQVLGAHEVAPALLPPAGVTSGSAPDAAAERDAARGMAVLDALSAADIGQACAVQAGLILSVEGIFGTDWMLDSLTARPEGSAGGLFCKAPKRGQDRRIDLPTIGPQTVQKVAQAGLTGIVLEAGGVMILEREAVQQACDALGLTLWIRPREGADQDGECAST